MSHELSQVSGRVEMFSAGELPWHGLGVNVAERQTAADAIKLAELDWPVEQADLTYQAVVPGKELTDLQTLPVPDKVANLRRDKDGNPVYLGTVGKTYRIIQNAEAFSFFDEVVGGGKAVYETAGAIRDGRRVWILAKLPDDLVLKAPGGEDRSKQYLLFVNSHDGSMTCKLFFTPVRVVCSNTLTSALSGAEREQGVTIYHKGDIQTKTREAVRILQIANAHYADIAQMFEHFIAHPMPEAKARDYFETLVPDVAEHGKRGDNSRKQTRDEMLYAYLHGVGADLAGQTLWGCYNAVTGWADHQSFVRRTPRTTSSRFESVVYGPMSRLKQHAFDAGRKLVGVA